MQAGKERPMQQGREGGRWKHGEEVGERSRKVGNRVEERGTEGNLGGSEEETEGDARGLCGVAGRVCGRGIGKGRDLCSHVGCSRECPRKFSPLHNKNWISKVRFLLFLENK